MYRKFNLLLLNVYRRICLIHWKLKGVTFGSNLRIHGRVVLIGDPRKLKIGNNVSLNHGVILNSEGGLIIGDNVTISAYSQLHSGALSERDLKQHSYAQILISENVWIASAVIVGLGVEIGSNCRIGANSFVNANLEGGYFYAGTPARKIAKI
jgi:putative colanic acid biosynthesis acetyltransferase WcaF